MAQMIEHIEIEVTLNLRDFTEGDEEGPRWANKGDFYRTNQTVSMSTIEFAKLMNDIIEEATRRGMQVGIAMATDAMQSEPEPEEQPRPFPGFLGEGAPS